MPYKTITEEYYSLWLTNTPDFLRKHTEKISFVYCEERNKVQLGYPCAYDLIAWIQDERVIISYGSKAEGRIDDLRRQLTEAIPIGALSDLLFSLYGRSVTHHIKFLYRHKPDATSHAKALEQADYPQYLAFFRKLNPTCRTTEWLEAYYAEMIREKLCCGVFMNDALVSCTDAPTVPYLAHKAQEIGINTLQEYRSRGYAAICCKSCIDHILQNNKCPLWSCSASNTASIRLAQKIGFVKLADFITMTI